VRRAGAVSLNPLRCRFFRLVTKNVSLYRSIDGGELFDRVLDDKFLLTEKACSIFMRQICEAMDYIHEHNIIHLDLKVSDNQTKPFPIQLSDKLSTFV
jgi:serine/threonine protein kinase